MTDIRDFIRVRLEEQKAFAGEIYELFQYRYEAEHQAEMLVNPRAVISPGRKQTDWLLRDIEAKERILKLHAPHEYSGTRGNSSPPVCGYCNREDGPESWPCETLRLLASPYKSHSDYQEEWEI